VRNSLLEIVTQQSITIEKIRSATVFGATIYSSPMATGLP